jgi:hypothetical protein
MECGGASQKYGYALPNTKVPAADHLSGLQAFRFFSHAPSRTSTFMPETSHGARQLNIESPAAVRSEFKVRIIAVAADNNDSLG